MYDYYTAHKHAEWIHYWSYVNYETGMTIDVKNIYNEQPHSKINETHFSFLNQTEKK